MSEIFINPSVVLSIAGDYGLQSKDIDGLALELTKGISDLYSSWEGNAARSFIPSMMFFVIGLNSVSKSIDGFSSKLLKANKAMSETDQALSDAY